MKRSTKLQLIAAMTIFILLLLSLITYVYIATNILDSQRPNLKNTNIQTMSVKVDKNHTSSLEATVALEVSFSVPSAIKASPQLGTFTLSTRVNGNHTICAFTTSTYKISDFDQLIFLNFQTDGLQMTSDNPLMLIRVGGDFEMHTELARFPLFPQAHQHIYFVCDVAFRRVQLDKIHFKRCETSMEPYNI
ncbi:hypothetical protein L1987_33254 [Smallanthus sonchifolius]|uniref:Uncharacterized protein n=1 Tax=Smallanthus sonchifolius TaxID=185202 RepID=A0ACB9HRQ0_9ASTR|nr:hypothetical protein L1987_33254 [Smallanthus sonchifolius]